MQFEWTIGRALECDIVVSDASVSSLHCRLIRNGDEWMLEDLRSTNGTFVNGNRITAPVPVSTTDNVILGVSASLPWPEIAIPENTRGKSTPLAIPSPAMEGGRSFEFTLGRDTVCDHVFDDPMISRRHAKLTRTRTGTTVEDLASSNGTFVNGQRITAATSLDVGDVVRFGSFELRLNPMGMLEECDLRSKLSIEARSLTVSVPGKMLIDDISLTIHPGEFVGLMGPSGAGKTTLMSAMNGYVRPTEGEVLFNGGALYGHYSQFAIRMGYVPQDDIIHRDLSVGEALSYTARLRLPNDYSAIEIEERVRTVLEQLGLSSVRNVQIGSAEQKGISGGQRKRVNLAMELLTDPQVLFLDEPTSGLSSEDALMVMKVLRLLADSGKTILLTIHQPSLEVFRLLDSLAIVSKDVGTADPGRLAYYGPAYPDAVSFFNPEARWPDGIDPSPDEVLRGLGTRPTADWVQRFKSSPHHRRYVTGRASSLMPPTPSVVRRSLKKAARETTHQWNTLIRRCLSIKVRDTWNTLTLLAQAPVVAVLIALTFGKRAGQDASIDLKTWTEVSNTLPVVLFVLVLSGLWFGCSNSVREIVGEWAIYRRERMVNLRIPAYVGSKFTVLCTLSALQCLVLMIIVYPGCSLKGSFFTHYLSLLLASWIGVGFGLVVSAATRTTEAAVALLPMAMLPMVMLGGVMMPFHDLPLIAKPIANIMPSRWAFEAMVENESEPQPHSPPIPAGSPIPVGAPIIDPTAAPRDMAEKFFPEEKGRYGIDASQFVMFLMLSTLYTAAHLILWRRDLH